MDATESGDSGRSALWTIFAQFTAFGAGFCQANDARVVSLFFLDAVADESLTADDQDAIWDTVAKAFGIGDGALGGAQKYDRSRETGFSSCVEAEVGILLCGDQADGADEEKSCSGSKTKHDARY